MCGLCECFVFVWCGVLCVKFFYFFSIRCWSICEGWGILVFLIFRIFLVAAGVFGFTNTSLSNFYADLILLGIGWNFLFIGATYLLTITSNEGEKNIVQGLNDFCVFGTVAFASLASGFILNCSGTSSSTGWGLVNLSMLLSNLLSIERRNYSKQILLMFNLTPERAQTRLFF